MTLYVALLRGINVGGNNLIKMPALKACFERHGFRNVATYIQSGNVLFSAPGSAQAALERRLEALLSETFGYRANVVLRSSKQMQNIVRSAPEGFGTKPEKYRYDVIFLKAPVTAPSALKLVPMKEGVDQAHAGKGVLYFSRLISKATQSRLGKLVALPLYQSVTIRNWNTTTAIVRLLEAADRA